jgi:DNA repair exonuclease SbcCD ATPase subunit
VEKLKKQLEEKDTELTAAFKELEKLDQYSKTLEDNLFTFQEYYTQIEQFVKELKCPKCHTPIKVTVRQPAK